MNSIKSSVLLLLSSVFVVIVLSACSNDDLPVNPSSDPGPSNIPNAVSDVRVLESGYVSTKLNVKATSPDNLVEFQREDFVITPLPSASTSGSRCSITARLQTARRKNSLN